MRQNGGWRGKGAWDGDIEKTTVVLTGVPKILGAEILLSLLDRIFFGCYDYVYLPMDMEKRENLGIAYVNFHKHSMAVECQRYFSGFSLTAWPGGNFSERNCRAEWSSIQGYEANIQRQKLNDWMNSKIPEDYKPMVFDEDGFRLPMNPMKDIFLQESQADHGHGKVRRWEEKWYGWFDLAETRGSLTMAELVWLEWTSRWVVKWSLFLRQSHFWMEETSNGHANSPERFPVPECRETRPWSQGVEGDGHTPSQDGAINAKVPRLLQSDPDPKACEVVKFGEPAPESEALARGRSFGFTSSCQICLPQLQCFFCQMVSMLSSHQPRVTRSDVC